MTYPNILLVEDNETLGYILKEYLEMKNFITHWAKDGKRGLALFRKQPFDLCILDVMMPEMDGFSLAAEMRRLEPAVPVIFLTAKALKVDVLKGFNLGADDYIIKPVDEEELVARIRAVLRRSKHRIVLPVQYEIGAYQFDYTNQKLARNGEVRQLTEREAHLA